MLVADVTTYLLYEYRGRTYNLNHPRRRVAKLARRVFSRRVPLLLAAALGNTRYWPLVMEAWEFQVKATTLRTHP